MSRRSRLPSVARPVSRPRLVPDANKPPAVQEQLRAARARIQATRRARADDPERDYDTPAARERAHAEVPADPTNAELKSLLTEALRRLAAIESQTSKTSQRVDRLDEYLFREHDDTPSEEVDEAPEEEGSEPSAEADVTPTEGDTENSQPAAG